MTVTSHTNSHCCVSPLDAATHGVRWHSRYYPTVVAHLVAGVLDASEDPVSWCDAGFHTLAYWQPAPNWKRRGFHKLLISNHFHRVTRWDRVTWFRDFGRRSRLLGRFHQTGSPAISVVTTHAKSRKSLYNPQMQGLIEGMIRQSEGIQRTFRRC